MLKLTRSFNIFVIGLALIAGTLLVVRKPDLSPNVQITVVEPVGPTTEEILDAVADIFLVKIDGRPAGSAFIARPGDGIVTIMATAAHIVEAAGQRPMTVCRMGTDQHPTDDCYPVRGAYYLGDGTDGAMLVVEGDLQPKVLTTLTPIIPPPGSLVYALTYIGGPDNLSMTVGAVLKGDALNTVLPIATIMHTAITNPGSSGSPLMVYRNGRLEIVGVTSFLYNIANISGAVPICYVVADLERLAQPMPPSAPNE